MGEPYIRLQGVGKSYETKDGIVEACAEVDLDIRQSEFVAIVGPSGCGKTTILKMVAGLVPHSAGSITVGGRKVERPLTDVGIVFQESILLDWRNVLSNVMLQIEIRGMDAAAGEPVARRLLQATGLAGFENKKPYELSGGMRQRVSICRALVHDPPLLLMDEPFGALDAMTRDEMNLELLRVWGEGGSETGGRDSKTILFVTHSIPEAVFLADRVVVMSPRPGRVARICPVRLPRPRTVQARASADFGRLSLEIYDVLIARPA